MIKPCNNCKNTISYQRKNGTTIYHCRDVLTQRCCEKMKKYEEYLENRRLYTKGKQVTSIEDFLKLKAKGYFYFYWRDSIRHISVLESLQFRVLNDLIRNGCIFIANRKDNQNNTL